MHHAARFWSWRNDKPITFTGVLAVVVMIVDRESRLLQNAGPDYPSSRRSSKKSPSARKSSLPQQAQSGNGPEVTSVHSTTLERRTVPSNTQRFRTCTGRRQRAAIEAEVRVNPLRPPVD